MKAAQKKGVGRDGARRYDNGRTGYEKARLNWENRKSLNSKVAGQVWVQRAAHSKRVARKKPIPENRKVKSGGHAHVPAGRTKKTTPKYVREYIGHTACDEIRLSVEFVTVEVLGICRHSCCD